LKATSHSNRQIVRASKSLRCSKMRYFNSGLPPRHAAIITCRGA